MSTLNLELAENEKMKMFSHNYKSKLLPAMCDCATSTFRGNLRATSMLFQMKLVDNPNPLLSPEGTLATPSHRLYQCSNLMAIWRLVMEFRDWMSSNGDAHYSIDHSLYIAEMEVYLNFYEEHMPPTSKIFGKTEKGR